MKLFIIGTADVSFIQMYLHQRRLYIFKACGDLIEDAARAVLTHLCVVESDLFLVGPAMNRLHR